MNPLLELLQHGQSYWIDNLTRHMIESGHLRHRVQSLGLRGITSNPAIFKKAIVESSDYDEQIEALVRSGRSVAEIYEELTTTDVRTACDILRPVYEESGGRDGYVSLEVSPHLAHDTEGSVAEARRLHGKVDRPNLLIKIPGTAEGVPAVEELLYEGIPVNITLLFSIESYEAVAEAYLRALERRREARLPLDTLASVASFFLSRIDVLVDKLLKQRIPPDNGEEAVRITRLLGRAAIANAKLAYQRFQALRSSERWRRLEAEGARVQRMLWASTSTKNPDYSDVMYVEPLIGADTVNTMPEETIAAFGDHGRVASTLEEGLDEAHRVMAELAAVGINFEAATEQLQNEGVDKFIEPYDALLRDLAVKAEVYRDRMAVGSLSQMACKLRRWSLRMTTEAASGHPTSAMSCAEIVAALFFYQMRWDPADPEARNVDRFVLSKGHAAPILWAALFEAGAIDEDPLSLRRIDSTLEGHPTPKNPWVKVATGSLGQGLSASCGIALANRLDGIESTVYCLLGDGECSEGAVWEAAQFASLNRLRRLVAIVDVNGLAQSGPTPYRHDTSVWSHRFHAFGWHTLEIDGHNLSHVLSALDEAERGEGPTAILARTEKGKGVSFLEGEDGWHGKPLSKEKLEEALAELGEADIRMPVAARRVGAAAQAPSVSKEPIEVRYNVGEQVATRAAFGAALNKLGARDGRIVVLDGDVKNSTGTEDFAHAFPNRFFQSYIAEQNMAGVALGLGVSGKVPFAATFACFLSRAYDFIRMAGHSAPPHLVFCGSHAGVSIGEDGPSQMGLEDIALFRATYGSTVLYPCDGVSAEHLTEVAARTPGIVYLRTTRPKTPVIYAGDEAFPVGGSKVLRSSEGDRCTVVAAGITVHEALKAWEDLQGEGIAIRVIDAYSVKPLDTETLSSAARETGAVVVVEDHWIEGGLGEAVAGALTGIVPVHRLGITSEPRSGTKEELLERHGISHGAIARRVREIVAPERVAEKPPLPPGEGWGAGI